jgi:hypothetical protein
MLVDVWITCTIVFCFAKTLSVLPKHFPFCQNTFSFYLLGLFIRIGEKLFQGYIQKSFLDFKKIWNLPKKKWCALGIAPPFFFQSSVFLNTFLLFAKGLLAVVRIAKNNDFYTNYPTPLPHATLTIGVAGASP